MAMAGRASACGSAARSVVAMVEPGCCGARLCHSELLRSACRRAEQTGRDEGEPGCAAPRPPSMAEPGRAYSDRLARGARRIRCCAARPFPWLATPRSRDSRTAYFGSLVSSSTSRKMTWLELSPGLRMALMRSTTAASAWMKHWLYGPPCCALGQRRGDGVIGRITKGDANHLRALDCGRAVISWRGGNQCPVRLAGSRACLHHCSGCFRRERLPGGICTHWKAPLCHGAHVKRSSPSAAVDVAVRGRAARYRRRTMASMPGTLGDRMYPTVCSSCER
jgi:hypothetical protein